MNGPHRLDLVRSWQGKEQQQQQRHKQHKSNINNHNNTKRKDNNNNNKDDYDNKTENINIGQSWSGLILCIALYRFMLRKSPTILYYTLLYYLDGR